ELVVGIKIEPTLAAGRFRPAVPGDAEGLQAAAGHFHEVLLQRCHAKGELDLELAWLAVRPLRAHEELAVAVAERRGGAVLDETGVAEIAQHRAAARMLHRFGMLRGLPGHRFALMTGRAARAADERRCLARR